MSFHMNKFMQYFAHNELIEQNDTKERNKHNDGGEYFVGLDFGIIRAMML